MNRLWLAVISGLLLGFVLMGMMLRGCEAGADATSSRPAALSGPVSKFAPRSVVRTEPDVQIRSTFGSPAAPIISRSPSASQRTQAQSMVGGADGSRGGTQTNNPFGGSEESALDLARQMALSRLPSTRNSGTGRRDPASSATPPNIVTIIENPVPGLERLSATLNVVATAQSELLAQIERDRQQRQNGTAGGSGSGDGAGDSGSGDDSAEAGGGGGGGGGEGTATTINASPSGGTTGGAGDSNSGIDDDSSSGGTTGGGGETSESENTDSPPPPPSGPTTSPPAPTPDPPSDPPLPPPDVIPPQGGGGSSEAVIARWMPVPIPSSFPDLQNFRSNDLFLGFTSAVSLQIVTSAAPFSLNIEGSVFHQNPVNGDMLPTPQTLVLAPSAEFDSFLTIGDLQGLLFPQGPDWGASLDAVWVTPIAQPLGAIAVQDPARFGDNRFYVRAGRFTATGNPTFVGGSLIVNAFDLVMGSPVTEFVTVPNDPALWVVEGAPTGPTLESLEFDSLSVVGGTTTGATVTLTAPAPESGATITLTSPSVHLSVPQSVGVAPGKLSVRFNVNTGSVDAAALAKMYAIFNGAAMEANITLLPVTLSLLDTVTLTPPLVRGGLPSEGRVMLIAPAPAGGFTAALLSSDFSVANVPGNVVIPAGATEAVFPVQTAPVGATRNIEISANASGQVRAATLTVAMLGDLDGDGRVNASDTAILLAQWNGSDPNADLNGDGVINGADLASLMANFNETTTGDGDPTSGAVIARWIPVTLPAGGCSALVNKRSNDLYFGFQQRPAIPGGPVITSQNEARILISGGSFYQDPLGSNGPTNDAILTVLPCLAFDSYLTIGGANPVFLPGTDLDPLDWGPAITAAWFTTDFSNIVVEQNPAKFGDNRHYIRAARLTADLGVQVDGEVDVAFVIDGAAQTVRIGVPNCPFCWQSFDLNLDGGVDSDDVGFVLSLMGSDNSRADLNRDGLVTPSDVELIVGEVANPSGRNAVR